MTGGAVAILGATGGFAFVLDLDGCFADYCNHELVDLHRVDTEPMGTHAGFLRGLVAEHAAETGSGWGGGFPRTSLGASGSSSPRRPRCNL